jgi:hypothetical protein
LKGDLQKLDTKASGQIVLDVRDLPDLVENLSKFAGTASAQSRLLATQIERMIPPSAKIDGGARFVLDVREGAVYWNGIRLTDFSMPLR